MWSNETKINGLGSDDRTYMQENEGGLKWQTQTEMQRENSEV